MFRTRRIAVTLTIAALPLIVAARRDPLSGSPPELSVHLALSRAEPKVNDTVAASPKSVRLWFTEVVDTTGTSIKIAGPDAKPVKAGRVKFGPMPQLGVMVSVDEPLKPGTYTVTWRAVAEDGDPGTGKFKFTVR